MGGPANGRWCGQTNSLQSCAAQRTSWATTPFRYPPEVKVKKTHSCVHRTIRCPSTAFQYCTYNSTVRCPVGYHRQCCRVTLVEVPTKELNVQSRTQRTKSAGVSAHEARVSLLWAYAYCIAMYLRVLTGFGTSRTQKDNGATMTE
eukprot:3720552-Rhodomonas_salina.1